MSTLLKRHRRWIIQLGNFHILKSYLIFTQPPIPWNTIWVVKHVKQTNGNYCLHLFRWKQEFCVIQDHRQCFKYAASFNASLNEELQTLLPFKSPFISWDLYWLMLAMTACFQLSCLHPVEDLWSGDMMSQIACDIIFL